VAESIDAILIARSLTSISGPNALISKKERMMNRRHFPVNTATALSTTAFPFNIPTPQREAVKFSPRVCNPLRPFEADVFSYVPILRSYPPTKYGKTE